MAAEATFSFDSSSDEARFWRIFRRRCCESFIERGRITGSTWGWTLWHKFDWFFVWKRKWQWAWWRGRRKFTVVRKLVADSNTKFFWDNRTDNNPWWWKKWIRLSFSHFYTWTVCEKRGRCRQCSKVKKISDVKWECTGCWVHLCVLCFEQYP